VSLDRAADDTARPIGIRDDQSPIAVQEDTLVLEKVLGARRCEIWKVVGLPGRTGHAGGNPLRIGLRVIAGDDGRRTDS